MKKYRMQKIITMLVLCILLTILFLINKIQNINRIDEKSILKENEILKETQLFSYVVYDNRDENNIKVLIKIDSEKGIEYVKCPNGNIVYANGEKDLAIEYIVKKEESYVFKVKENERTEQEESLYIDNNVIQDTTLQLSVEKVTENELLIYLNKKIELSGYNSSYYKIGENDSWRVGSIADWNLSSSNVIKEDNTITISGKIVSTSGYEVIVSKNISVNDLVAKTDAIQADSILHAVSKEDLQSGKCEITVAENKYNTKIYNIEGNIDISSNITFGMAEDIGSANGNASRMIIVKVNGNLNVKSGTNVGPYYSNYGGPKGFLIYCTGTLTNNGTIQNNHGAKAVGENVYLWQNENGSYEYVPAGGTYGGAGGSGQTGYNGRNGLTPGNASGRATGGGGRWCWTICRI